MTEWMKKHILATVVAAMLFGAMFLAGPVAVIVFAVKKKVQKVESRAAKPATTADAQANPG